MNNTATRIANVMLGRGKNGIKQAFLDYNEALAMAGFEAVPIISRAAAVETELGQSGRDYHAIRQWGTWDVVAGRALSHIFRRERVAAVIAHGNRALSLCRQALGQAAPLIAVAHNYRTGRCNLADAVIAVAPDLRDHLARHFKDPERIFLVPNTVRSIEARPAATRYRTPPMIGTMGRMVGKKGFRVFCVAMAELKSSGIPFQAVIAGDGEDRMAIEHTIHALGLDREVSLPGWIHDKGAFWPAIDIFCIPSLHEPFGLVLLEAWAAGKPVISTDAEGPRSIAEHNRDALIIPTNDAQALAQSVQLLLANPAKAHDLAMAGYQKARTRYARETAAAALKTAMSKLVGR
jgi:glycosyltransferase involved in cell wall biosynthesis